MPALLNTELPFRYPAALYARKAQGNVTLMLYVDRDGRVVPESTRIDEPSGFAAFDSAAVLGPISIQFPVYFRHPEARPLPGDSILQSAPRGSDDV
jgi:TonB family protein